MSMATTPHWIEKDGRLNAIAAVIYDPKQHAETYANALLIEAAPDLLESLKEIINSDMAMREEDEGRHSIILQRARIAIAKAEKEPTV